MLKLILQITLVFLMLICCIIEVTLGNWYAFGLFLGALIFDIIDAILAFKEWRRGRSK